MTGVHASRASTYGRDTFSTSHANASAEECLLWTRRFQGVRALRVSKAKSGFHSRFVGDADFKHIRSTNPHKNYFATSTSTKRTREAAGMASRLIACVQRQLSKHTMKRNRFVLFGDVSRVFASALGLSIAQTLSHPSVEQSTGSKPIAVNQSHVFAQSSPSMPSTPVSTVARAMLRAMQACGAGSSPEASPPMWLPPSICNAELREIVQLVGHSMHAAVNVCTGGHGSRNTTLGQDVVWISFPEVVIEQLHIWWRFCHADPQHAPSPKPTMPFPDVWDWAAARRLALRNGYQQLLGGALM